MGTEDWVLNGTKLITNTKKQKLKIQSRVRNFKNTMLKNSRRKRKRKKEKQSHKNYLNIYIYRYKIDNKYQKAKIKNLEQSLEFKNTMLKKRRRKRKRKKVTKIIKIDP